MCTVDREGVLVLNVLTAVRIYCTVLRVPTCQMMSLHTFENVLLLSFYDTVSFGLKLVD